MATRLVSWVRVRGTGDKAGAPLAGPPSAAKRSVLNAPTCHSSLLSTLSYLFSPHSPLSPLLSLLPLLSSLYAFQPPPNAGPRPLFPRWHQSASASAPGARLGPPTSRPPPAPPRAAGGPGPARGARAPVLLHAGGRRSRRRRRRFRAAGGGRVRGVVGGALPGAAVAGAGRAEHPRAPGRVVAAPRPGPATRSFEADGGVDPVAAAMSAPATGGAGGGGSSSGVGTKWEAVALLEPGLSCSGAGPVRQRSWAG